MNRTDILWSLCSQSEKKTARGLLKEDIEYFVNAVRKYPHKTVRVYSDMGFILNSYRYRCNIERITRNGQTGKITIDWGSAQRSYGRGALVTVNNRGI